MVVKSRPKILFFSRGRGHGHAFPDLAIAAEVEKIADLDIQFASYATGARTLAHSRWPVHDLSLPEENQYLPTFFKALDLISREEPQLVVAHEEFSALAAAHMWQVPSVFLSAWLPSTGNVAAESLSYASAVVVIDHPGIFPVPPEVRVVPRYVGPIVRQMKFTLADRPAVRRDLSIGDDETMITVCPGGWATEQRAPIADTILSAFFKLPEKTAQLYWLAGADYDRVSAFCAGISGIHVLKFVDPIERLIVASDVIITKGTRGITLDASALGVPSISLSARSNPIDEILVPRIRTNLALYADAIDGEALADYIRQLARSPNRSPRPSVDGNAAAKVAAILVGALESNQGSRKDGIETSELLEVTR